MRPFGKEDDAKKSGPRLEPLCLFCFPEETLYAGRTTYVRSLPKKEDNLRRWEDVRTKQKEDFWLRKRTEARIRRRRAKEPVGNLKSFLLASVKYDKVPRKTLPSLFEVLETVKDAWPSPSRNKPFLRSDDKKLQTSQLVTPKQTKMKDEPVALQPSSQLLNRRFSVPEELMRKYSVSKEKTSEESESNKTTIEVSSSSSSSSPVDQGETARRLLPEAETARTQQAKADVSLQTSEAPKRVTQAEYYSRGSRVIKVRAAAKGTCTCRGSSTTASAKEETDDSGTGTDSLSSSSPTRLPKGESSSGNLSSESDRVRCTCAELTSSKETSTDLFHSGKSTLSQTVSDKSVSTQDSTASVNSVSTRGSTLTDNSQSTSPEAERTSAKETPTSPDCSPRTPRSNGNRKNRRRDDYLGHRHSKTCPRHEESKPSGNGPRGSERRQCPVHSERPPEGLPKTTANAATNTEDADAPKGVRDGESAPPAPFEERYKWAKLSQEEIYMMQQLRHRKFVENQRRLSSPLPALPDGDSIGSCGTGSVYNATEGPNGSLMIPRYSALPRTLSMLVNTSSPDASLHNSDSDNQSLADSLEDQPVTHVHKLYFDTKRESKPVRGDVSLSQENKFRHRQPRGRAFFVSIKDPYGEDEMLESIEKIPQPPEKIKNQIFERHLNLCTKHKHLHPSEQKPKSEANQKKRKLKNKNDKNEEKERMAESKKTQSRDEGRKVAAKKQEDGGRTKPGKTEEGKGSGRREGKEQKGRAGSKIPVPVSSRSTSSSPEREADAKQKQPRPKIRMKREKERKGEGEGEGAEAVRDPRPKEVETTQILEITHAGTELGLRKPQAVIHPSQTPFEDPRKTRLTIPPLASTLGIQPWNKPLLLAPARRSPVGKFWQRFEVIPEEKSSSLSSAEERNGREAREAKECLPKFADASTSPLLEDKSDKIQFRSYHVNEVPNLIVAKIADRQLEALPSVKSNDSQKIILFSSKSHNSSKGRDALIAMNREDFNRLAKGWMNFYKLSETLDNSENEENLKLHKSKESKTQNESKEENKEAKNEQKTREDPRLETSKKKPDRTEAEPDENLRFHSSNTILRSDPEKTSRQTSLPDLKPLGRGEPRVAKSLEDDDTDSDSTDYLEPPSPRVPPLSIGDIPSDDTLSSSEGELDDPKPQSVQFVRRGANVRTKGRKDNSRETSRFGKKKNSGWSVTVAGTVELSRSAPDLEMRLSFPASGAPPVVCQSDSGFAEDSNYSKLSGSLQDLDSHTSRRELPLGSGNMQQKWMVTVKNPRQGSTPDLTKFSTSSHRLPDLETSRNRNANKVLKDARLKRVLERKMRAIWPQVQQAIKKEFLTESGRLVAELDDALEEDFRLLVRGSAVSLERKEKPPTMTEGRHEAIHFEG